MQLKQIFIEWILETHSEDEPVYLRGANKEKIVTCMKILFDSSQEWPSLKYYHEEADDRALFNTNHINAKRCQKVIITSPDTDVFIDAINYLTRWKSKRRGSDQIILVSTRNHSALGQWCN